MTRRETIEKLDRLADDLWWLADRTPVPDHVFDDLLDAVEHLRTLAGQLHEQEVDELIAETRVAV